MRVLRATAKTKQGRIQGILVKESEKNVVIDVDGKKVRRNKDKHKVITFYS